MTAFAIGQRYLSDLEPALGLGVIVNIDERSVQVLFPAAQETRIYAKNAMALSRVAFGVGDTVTDHDGNRHTVVGVDDIDGVLRYVLGDNKSLMETRLAANITLDKPLERLLAGKIAPNHCYEVRQDALTLKKSAHSHKLRGLLGARIEAIPHQLYIAYEVGKRLHPRVLLADEVGLGKTIEAGLILHNQLTTGRASRVLVLVPDSLQYQWAIELKRRFHLDFALFDLVRTAAIKEHNPTQNVFSTEQCVICSIDLLLDHQDLFVQAMEADFDMLVVDEAHHLHWDGSQGNDKYALVEALSGVIQGLLLLSATPEQLGVESHFARLHLLDKERFFDLQTFVQEQEEFSLVAGIADFLLSDTPLSDKKIQTLAALLAKPEVSFAGINTNPTLKQQVLSELIDRHGTGRVLFRNTRESIKGFLGRHHIAYALPMPTAWVNSPYTQGSLKERLWGEESFLDGSWLESDPRVPWLMKLLTTTLKHQKVLLIARSGATVQALELALRLHANIKTALFTEEMSLLERDQAAVFFAQDNGAQILLCSEIGSEGRNFQFVHHLVLFDLPANADTLEQRIGRLDRIGQSQTITLHIPYVAGTATERLYHWYNRALNMFDHISPTAQSVQEAFVQDLKPLLCADDHAKTQEEFVALLDDALDYRQVLEAQLQEGRDRLLEYSSCRAPLCHELCTQFQNNNSDTLRQFLSGFFDATGIDYHAQQDGSWVIYPPNASELMEEDLSGLALSEDGMSATFDREQALSCHELDYLTHNHPFVQSVHDTIAATGFGNAAVAALTTKAMPEGMLLLEVQFALACPAPKALNIETFLPNEALRFLLTETGENLSNIAPRDKIAPLIHRIDSHKARQLVKLRTQTITNCYESAYNLAKQALPQLTQTAQERFALHFDAEIDRLRYLQSINPSVGHHEIDALTTLKEQGMHALGSLSLVPDSLRVLVVVRQQNL